MNYNFYALSDIGRIRKENQDNYLVLQKEDEMICAVFDGVGGCDDGKYAADFCRDFLERSFLEGKYFGNEDVFQQKKDLHTFIEDLNEKIQNKIKELGKTLYSTISFIYFFKNNYYILNVGDSRIYLIRDNSIFQMTKDDNVKKGEYSTNILSQVIGDENNIVPHIFFENIMDHDRFIMCTDGLTSYLDEKDILENVRITQNVDDCVIELVNKASHLGGADNITCIYVKLD